MESISLSCRVVSLFRVVLAAVTTVLVVIAALFFKILILVFICAFLFLYFFYLPSFVKSYKVTKSAGCLSVLRGVFIKKESVFKKSQLLYVRTAETPLCRLFGCKIIVLSAPRVRFIIVADNMAAEKLLGDGYDKT